jgi:mono/diheme cytochrome c family protein
MSAWKVTRGVGSEDFVMKYAIYLMTPLALSFALTEVCAQSPGDPKVGFALAQQVCSVCHATERGQVSSPNSKAPTFVQLATSPGMTSTALLVALSTPHAGMPMFRLTTEEREGVIVYILSLH